MSAAIQSSPSRPLTSWLESATGASPTASFPASIRKQFLSDLLTAAQETSVGEPQPSASGLAGVFRTRPESGCNPGMAGPMCPFETVVSNRDADPPPAVGAEPVGPGTVPPGLFREMPEGWLRAPGLLLRPGPGGMPPAAVRGMRALANAMIQAGLDSQDCAVSRREAKAERPGGKMLAALPFVRTQNGQKANLCPELMAQAPDAGVRDI